MMATPFSMPWVIVFHCRCHRRPGHNVPKWQKAINPIARENLDRRGLFIIGFSGNRAATSNVLALTGILPKDV